MRISFDVDDTLVCGSPVHSEQFLSWWRRWLYPERIRLGTRDLMLDLVSRHHEVWVYTTSFRSPRYCAVGSLDLASGCPAWSIKPGMSATSGAGDHRNSRLHSGLTFMSMIPMAWRKKDAATASMSS